MKEKNDGGPAYPVNKISDPEEITGMSQRAYFAGQALSGLCASIKYRPTSEPTYLVAVAVKLSDALIKELNK